MFVKSISLFEKLNEHWKLPGDITGVSITLDENKPATITTVTLGTHDTMGDLIDVLEDYHLVPVQPPSWTLCTDVTPRDEHESVLYWTWDGEKVEVSMWYNSVWRLLDGTARYAIGLPPVLAWQVLQAPLSPKES